MKIEKKNCFCRKGRNPRKLMRLIDCGVTFQSFHLLLTMKWTHLHFELLLLKPSRFIYSNEICAKTKKRRPSHPRLIGEWCSNVPLKGNEQWKWQRFSVRNTVQTYKSNAKYTFGVTSKICTTNSEPGHTHTPVEKGREKKAFAKWWTFPFIYYDEQNVHVVYYGKQSVQGIPTLSGSYA